MRILLVVCLVASLVGCASHKQVVPTAQGPVTVQSNDNNKTMTMTTKQGTMTFGAGVDISKIGLPIYPGATKNEGGMSGTSAQGSGEIVALSTTDSFDKVYAWYKSHLPAGSEAMHTTGQTGSVASFQIGKSTDKEQRSVMITSGTGKTSILLSHNVKP